MTRSPGGITFQDLLNEPDEQSAPLIENLIYDRDNVMLIGKEKANKSTLALQMVCNLTSGEPLFGQFNVPNAVDCVYLQAEGKRDNTKRNLRNMMKVVPCDPSKAKLLYYPSIQMNKPDGLNRVIAEIDNWRKPKLIVIDPLYQSMAGKIEEQEASSTMTANIRLLADRYECAILLLHHAHRPRRNDSGEVIDEGDDSVFGSFVWKAFPDTVLLISKVQGHKLHRRLSCGTQRMGNVMPELELTLIEPEPFYLKIRDDEKPIDDLVYKSLTELSTIDTLVLNTGKSRRHVTEALWRLTHHNKARILNPGQKPILWARSLETPKV